MAEVVEPVTRLRIADDGPGWSKLTALPAPIEKLPQLTIARGEVWVTVRSAPLCWIAAAPDATTPWVGNTVCAEVGTTESPTAAAIAISRIDRGILGNGIV